MKALLAAVAMLATLAGSVQAEEPATKERVVQIVAAYIVYDKYCRTLPAAALSAVITLLRYYVDRTAIPPAVMDLRAELDSSKETRDDFCKSITPLIENEPAVVNTTKKF